MNDVFLNNPNLPSADVTQVLVSVGDAQLNHFLADKGISALNVSKSDKIDAYCADHADILAYHLGNGKFIADKTAEKALNGFYVQEYVNVRSPYPNDCILNAADIGDFLICNTKIICNSILKSAERQNKQIINVKQGYAKCSVCIVKRNTLITDDESIYREISKISCISALLVSKGSVSLVGQNYGFLGGASGLLGKDYIFFNGDIKSHTDFTAIKQFLDYHKVKYTDIKNKPLTDVGSIIPIKQKGSKQ